MGGVHHRRGPRAALTRVNLNSGPQHSTGVRTFPNSLYRQCQARMRGRCACTLGKRLGTGGEASGVRNTHRQWQTSVLPKQDGRELCPRRLHLQHSRLETYGPVNMLLLCPASRPPPLSGERGKGSPDLCCGDRVRRGPESRGCPRCLLVSPEVAEVSSHSRPHSAHGAGRAFGPESSLCVTCRWSCRDMVLSRVGLYLVSHKLSEWSETPALRGNVFPVVCR